jgi:Fe-S cluster assembly protein SufD
VTTAIQNTDHYLETFTAFEKQTRGEDPRWLEKLRETALARFFETGFPTTRDEDWRFTNVSAIARTPFRRAGNKPTELSPADLAAWKITTSTAQLVFVDGQFVAGLSALDGLTKGLTVSGLKHQIRRHPEVVEAHLGRYVDIHRDPFPALNTAFAEDGAYVHIARGTVVSAPIHLLFVSTTRDTPEMTHPRNLVVVEDEGQVTVIEEYISLGSGSVLSNGVTELVAGESANVRHHMIVREQQEAFHISTLRIEQARSATVSSHSLLLGGGLVRNNVHPVLRGEGGECLINGLFVGNGHQHLDNYMLVEHAGPHSSSRQFYNGILDEHAHGVFHGRIVVHKDAQKTDAKQTNRNLLLSDDAQVDTKPQLEIYADDVKCTHGATIGQIDENSLFYLQSRGIDRVAARRLLLSAFASECLARMKADAARDHAEQLIHTYLLSFANTLSEGSADPSRQRESTWEEVG